MTILDEIAAHTRIRVEKKKKETPLDMIKEKAYKMYDAEKEAVSEKECMGTQKEGRLPAFEAALRKEEISFICEVKKASPSKGLIAPEFPYLEIAGEYEEAGAAAISCLTEPEYFLGADRYLAEIAEQVKIPVLRKDFTVDAYQIYEAKLLGAGAVLLICALLDEKRLKEYIQIAESLGLSALVEAHDREEIEMGLSCGAGIIGVNNRNLKNFTVNVENCLALRPYVPEKVVFVAESGIQTAGDIQKLREGNVQAVLIGETLMRCADKKAMLDTLRG